MGAVVWERCPWLRLGVTVWDEKNIARLGLVLLPSNTYIHLTM
jgi:hypothetical protein